jgi:DNA-directed RNA polymerase specialized sigma24 family protein
VKYREVVILCDLHDLSYADAAAALHTSVAAVRSRLHRGRYLLRQRFAAAAAATVRRPDRSSVRCLG